MSPCYIGAVSVQEQLWRETVCSTPRTEADAQRGEKTPANLNPRMMHDIQILVSRLVGKARQLLGNQTTNLAECWMHIRSKFDGGKVINRSQSGSWEYRCLGAGLQQNLGKEWGPTAWTTMTHSPANQVFANTANSSAKKTAKDRKRKATQQAKESRRSAKYSKVDNSLAALKLIIGMMVTLDLTKSMMFQKKCLKI